MYKIVKARRLADKIFLMDVHARVLQVTVSRVSLLS